jgi:hypothetical protein
MAPKGKIVQFQQNLQSWKEVKDHHDIDINIDVAFEKDDKMVITQVEHYANLDEDYTKKFIFSHKVNEPTNHPHLQYVLVLPNKHFDSWDCYY